MNIYLGLISALIIKSLQNQNKLNSYKESQPLQLTDEQRKSFSEYFNSYQDQKELELEVVQLRNEVKYLREELRRVSTIH